MTSKPARTIFLSHAAADVSLVEAFETLLSKSTGLISANIFCSSLEGQGAGKGGSFVDEIRTEVTGAKAVVALISPAYLDSPFCMAELGAAWAFCTKRIPIIVPPNDFTSMNATLLGIVGVSIDNEDALAQAFEELCQSIGTALPTTAVRSRAMREFNRTWSSSLKNTIAGPRRIDSSIHAALKHQLDEAIDARDAAEFELSTAEAQIEALRKAKDVNDVTKIAAKFDKSDWETKFNDALNEIRELYLELGGKEIARLLILERLGKPSYPDENAFRDEIGRAVELDVYDIDTKMWNHRHTDVKALYKLVDEVVELFQEDSEAGKTLKTRAEKNDPTNIRFWESHL